MSACLTPVGAWRELSKKQSDEKDTVFFEKSYCYHFSIIPIFMVLYYRKLVMNYHQLDGLWPSFGESPLFMFSSFL